MHLAVYLASHKNDQSIADAARQQGIIVNALSTYYQEPISVKSSALLLGFGDTDQQNIIRAAKIVTRLLRLTF